MPVVQVWPCPGKSIEQLQFVSASGPLGCTSAGISCITFLTFSSEFGSDFGAGNKKSHYHKGAYNIYWNSNFFSLSKLFFKFCKPHRINVKHKLISLISGTTIWAQERMAVLSLLAYCKFLISPFLFQLKASHILQNNRGNSIHSTKSVKWKM